jgi:hypothetical protein
VSVQRQVKLLNVSKLTIFHAQAWLQWKGNQLLMSLAVAKVSSKAAAIQCKHHMLPGDGAGAEMVATAAAHHVAEC